MPARKRPTPQDSAAARRILLGGLAQDTDVADLAGELAPLHPRNNTFPGEVFHVAADALDWCGASRADPLALEEMRERFLPECAFRGRQNHKLQFAILAAAALRGGAGPDLLDEVAWWQSDDFWQYALYAAVAHIRPPPAEPACRCARHARNWPSATARGPHEPSLMHPDNRARKWPASYQARQPGRVDRTGGVKRRGPGCRSGST